MDSGVDYLHSKQKNVSYFLYHLGKVAKFPYLQNGDTNNYTGIRGFSGRRQMAKQSRDTGWLLFFSCRPDISFLCI